MCKKCLRPAFKYPPSCLRRTLEEDVLPDRWKIFRTSQGLLKLDALTEGTDWLAGVNVEGIRVATAMSFAEQQGIGLLAVDHAVFHHEGSFLQGGDVLEGVAGDGDYIGGIAGLKDADFIIPGQ